MQAKSVIARCHLYGRQMLDPAELHAQLIIAADSGYLSAKKCGVKPHMIVGDFDSAPVPAHEDTVEIRRVPAEKDDTDTTLACRIAAERGARDILIVGGRGGRLDHTLSNLFLIESLTSQGLHVMLTDGENRTRLLKDESVTLSVSRYPYFSLLTLGTSRLSLQGCKYPLTDATLTKCNQYAVSNEITADEAVITVSGDPVFLIESGAQTR